MARRKREEIPQSAEELTAAWLNSALAHRTNGATLTRLDTQVIGGGIGFVGELHRCSLEWDSDDDSFPSSLIVKIPTKVGVNRALGEGLLAYEREIRVYRDFGGKLGLPMPEHWHSAMDPDPAPWLTPVILFLLERLPLGAVGWLTDRFLKFAEKGPRRYILVIEDIHDAKTPTQIDGGTVDDVRIGLPLLAKFHAQHWMAADTIETHDHLWPLDRTPKVIQVSYRRNRDAFVDRFGDLMSDGLLARMDAIQGCVAETMKELVAAPFSILHGDYRLDNLMYRPNGDVVVVDYQLLCYGRPAWDVAYFITTALSPEHRHEQDSLLRTYHDALLAEGITDYDFARLEADVELTKDVFMHRLIGTGDMLNTDLDGRDHSFVDLATARVIGWAEH